jgi:FkbM family methyltransferase
MQDFLRNSIVARELLSGPRYLRQRWLRYRDQPAVDAIHAIQNMVVGDVQVRVPEFDGEFIMSPKSHIFHRLAQFGEYEPRLIKIILNAIVPDKDVIDVGANLGFFSCAAAKRLTTGRVLAIEPTDGAHRRLLHNLALNGVTDKVIVFKGLASDNVGDSDIHYIDGMEEYSSIEKSEHPAVMGMEMASIKVPAMPIDRLVLENGIHPTVIKVDVEGAEGLVFKGAQETLREFRPLVLAELNRKMLGTFGYTPEELINGFKQLGYKTVDPLRPGVEPGTIEFGDLLCLPEGSY